MRPVIRDAIIKAFSGSPTRSQQSLLDEISRLLGIKSSDVYQTLMWMKDAGEIAPEGNTGWRLTLSGIQASAPFIVRTRHYLSVHWIAIVALAISLIALIKD